MEGHVEDTMAMTTDTAIGDVRSRPTAARGPDPDDEPVVSRSRGEPPAHLELMDDEYALSILASLSDGPKRGRDLIDACEGSRATVYRRLDRLEAAGFVTGETTLDLDGHHCKEFRLVRDTVTLTVENGGLTVTAR